MNQVAEEINELMHIGVKRRSGRYPWGSGDDPYQHGRDFIGRIEELKKQGWTETPDNIMKEFGLTTTQYRTEKALAKDERRALQVETAKRLRDKEGLGATEIGRKMGLTESTVRSLLNENSEARMKQAQNTADFLKARMDEIKESGGLLDVGTGVERELNISKEKLNQALYLLEREGYEVYNGRFSQVTNPGAWTTQRVLCPPGTEHKEIYDLSKVHTIKEYVSHDGGETFDKFVYPSSMDSKRLMVRYKDDVGPDGARGIDKDGIIELRRGVADLSLGNDHYSQVRIMVDGTHYLKGMAVYSDDLPKGVDIVFNTNKSPDIPALGPKNNTVLKPIKDDPDNPFGSLIKAGGQSYYTDANGNKQLSLINKARGEGDWSDWKDALPSQFLGKQSLAMAKKQLNLAKADKQAEFDEICSLTNPTVKKHLLEKFADGCDSAAVNLQAAALPGQKYHVIIPINSLKDNEVYAPNYENGTQLALIRYPHGGTFEIPILTVNNKHAPAKKLLGTDIVDAVGITSKVAERLSGADFDGDTVMCIPTNDKAGKVKISSRPPLEQLEGFDPKTSYSYDKVVKDAAGNDHYYRNGKEFRVMKNTGTQMGIVSNLITDMTLAGAGPEDLAKAVKHSMVVIDAEKHKLDYKQSEIDNDIATLHERYQGKKTGGAATILSKSKGQYSVDKRQGSPRVNQKGKEWYDPTKPEGALVYKKADDLYYPDRAYDKASGKMTIRTADGKKITYDVTDADASARYAPVKRVNKDTGEVTYTDATGKITYKLKSRKQQSTKMAETDDAYTLLSDARHPMEIVYADYANSMKSLANQARMEMVTTGKIEYSSAAKATYQAEVDSLYSKLNTALLNTTRERAAQRKANVAVQTKQKENPNMKPGDLKKAGQQALTKYRSEVGSISRSKRSIKITDREWEAIQAGAISENKLKQILNNTDIDVLRERATPRATTALSAAKVNRIKAMSNSNYSLSEIARALGVSTSTVSNYLKGVN